MPCPIRFGPPPRMIAFLRFEGFASSAAVPAKGVS
jgi:hypothetical protein